MLKQTVKYTDFDDNESMETLYFNLTKSELADNMNLEDELEKLQQDFTGMSGRKLKTEEIQRVLDLVKLFMRLSYGVRSEDGKRFIKTPQIWEEFTQTAAYDEFLFGLFQDPQNAFNFMVGILPKDLRTPAMEALKKENGGIDPIRQASVMAAQEEQRKKHEESVANNVVALQNSDAPVKAEVTEDPQPTLSNPPTKEEIDAMTEWMARQK
ncbi:hypothetical protein SEA_PHEROBRINE_56 [Gordonia phage Pherobrine]|nr:hypothetical protein SEA_PHEROBRINE_56 [Gordonia phage Pherobrine]